jgi:hypothetical protein
MSNNDVVQVSGFAKKKALEAAGYTVEKVPTEQGEQWVVYDASCPGAVYGSATVVAADRLQGPAVNKALEALGGL